jgi:putative PEP-CTERM system histidine kinase
VDIVLELILSLIAFFLLVFLSVSLILKEKTAPKVTLSFAVLLLAGIELIDYCMIRALYDPAELQRYMAFTESLLPLTFSLFSLSYARSSPVKTLSLYWWAFILSALLFPVSVVIIPINDFFYAPDFLTERMLFLGRAGYWFYIGLILYFTVALMNVEMTFSAISRTEKTKMKFDFIGISSMLAVLIFYYSQGLLYRSINMNLEPIRSGVLIMSSALIAYSRFFRGNGARVVISRYVVYRSVTLLLVGAYFLILGTVGAGLRYFGVAFSKDLTIFLAFAMGILTLFVIFSDTLRRKAKVFINKNFFSYKHDYRREWLDFTGRLASCRSFAEAQEAILTKYRETFGLKGASLYLLDEKKAAYTPCARQSMVNSTLCLRADTPVISYFVERQRIFNPLHNEYLPNSEELCFINEAGAKLIVPLIGNGAVEGFVVFGDQLVQEELIYEDYDLMRTLAKQAALSVINFRLSDEITETREIAAVGKISSFVVHDLKNLASSFSLTLDNVNDNMQNPEFQSDMIVTMKKAAAKMNSLVQKLKAITTKKVSHRAPADIDALVNETIADISGTYKTIKISYQGQSAPSVVDAEEIKMVVLNLILNASDALNGVGRVEVETGLSEDNVYIRVKDKGCGMTEDFINGQLFRPFRTTKKKGLGIGLFQCKQIVEAHGGRCEVKSEAGKGSVFTIYLPSAKGTACVLK